jgi:hypothetical protein
MCLNLQTPPVKLHRTIGFVVAFLIEENVPTQANLDRRVVGRCGIGHGTNSTNVLTTRVSDGHRERTQAVPDDVHKSDHIKTAALSGGSWLFSSGIF